MPNPSDPRFNLRPKKQPISAVHLEVESIIADVTR